MSDSNSELRCTFTCWALGGLAGVLAIVLLVLLGDFSWPGAIFTGAVLGVVVGLLLGFLFCRPLPRPGEMSAGGTAASQSGTSAGGAGMAPAAGTAAAAGASAAEAAAETAGKAVGTAEAKAAEIAETAAEEVEETVAEAKAALEDTAPVAAAAPGDDVDRDGDGKIEGVNEGTRPEALDGPRGGAADDLKMIKGVGPKMEGMLNELGFYHFDQIAGWTADEVAWVDSNLKGFKGRVSRDNWVEQAKLLASGGETEFSKKVGDGDVY